MTTPEPPTEQHPEPEPTPAPPHRRFRFTRFGVLLALGALAILVVGGVIGALAFPRSASAAVPPPRPGIGQQAGPPGPGGHGPARGRDRGPARGPGGPGPGAAGVGQGPAVAGTVVSTGTGTLVVAPDGGAPQRTLKTDTNTRVDGPGARALTDLKPGERVVVSVQGTGDAATATLVRTPVARVVGTVTALAGTVATVTATDGLVVQVDVSKANPQPVVGDLITASGPVSGTSIAADQVRVLPKAS